MVGRKYANEDELLTDDDDDNIDSSDDEDEQQALNHQIAELKRMLGANERIIKGEDGGDEMDTLGDMDGLDDLGNGKLAAEDKKKKQREEDAKARKAELDNWREIEDAKFEKALEDNAENTMKDLEAKKNTVL